jgi:hypothetical protein
MSFIPATNYFSVRFGHKAVAVRKLNLRELSWLKVALSMPLASLNLHYKINHIIEAQIS